MELLLSTGVCNVEVELELESDAEATIGGAGIGIGVSVSGGTTTLIILSVGCCIGKFKDDVDGCDVILEWRVVVAVVVLEMKNSGWKPTRSW